MGIFFTTYFNENYFFFFLGVSVKAFLIQTKITKEGEELKNYQTPLEVQCDESGSDLFFLWPVVVVHIINDDSPFYNFSPKMMRQQMFEIVVIFEGTIESTGQSVFAKTSFLPNEILWGYRFENMVKFNEDLQLYEADYRKFDKMNKEIFTPAISAQEIDGGNCLLNMRNNKKYILELL